MTLEHTGSKKRAPRSFPPQNLFNRPERVRCLRCFDVKHVVERQADVAEPETLGRMRRLYECDGPLACPAQRGTQQPEFANARVLHQQVHQRTHRPSAAR